MGKSAILVLFRSLIGTFVLILASATPARIVISTPAGAGLVNTPLAVQPVVTLVDAAGNAVTGKTDTVTVSKVSGPGTVSGGTSALSSASGRATFSSLQLSALGVYVLLFSTTVGGNTYTAQQSSVLCTVRPTAKHAVAVADTASLAPQVQPSVVVSLSPHSSHASAATSGQFSCKITSLPTEGSLFNVAPNYSKYNYLPVKGAAITSTGTAVTDSQHRVLFEGSLGFSSAVFRYSSAVGEGGGLESQEDGVVAVTSTSKVLLASYFYQNSEGWTVVSAQTVAASWSPTSTGSLNFFIYGTPGDLVLGANNNARWFFEAPGSWYSPSSGGGHLANTYGGQLQFWLGPLAGDFVTPSLQHSNPKRFVEIRCDTCNSGKGIVLAQRDVIWGGGIQRFTFTLNEASGWLKDPFDWRVSEWPTPTACEFVEALSNVSSIRVYGDLTKEYEAVAIDEVTLTVGTGVPGSCYT